MTHLYIIRHGEAAATTTNPLEDPRLTALGIAQAERLRDRLAATGEIRADVLISSTMLRARQTAEILAPALALPILHDDEVQEWRFPEDESLNVDEYIEHFRSVAHDQKPFFQIAAGAESWVQFMLRASIALNRITQKYENKTIVLICHGGIVDASFHLFLHLSTLHIAPVSFDTHNTAITHWVRPEGVVGINQPQTWSLETFNDSMHLRDLHATTRIPWRSLQSGER